MQHSKLWHGQRSSQIHKFCQQRWLTCTFRICCDSGYACILIKYSSAMLLILQTQAQTSIRKNDKISLMCVLTKHHMKPSAAKPCLMNTTSIWLSALLIIFSIWSRSHMPSTLRSNTNSHIRGICLTQYVNYQFSLSIERGSFEWAFSRRGLGEKKNWTQRDNL